MQGRGLERVEGIVGGKIPMLCRSPGTSDTLAPPLLLTETVDLGGHLVRYHVSGRGEDLILLHGFPETLQAWAAHVSTLAQQFRVHAFDWMGLGGSDAPLEYEYSFGGYTRMLWQMMDALGLENAHLVATDIAVPPALLMTMGRKERVRSLTVFDGPIFDRPRLYSWEIHVLQTPGFGEVLVHGIPRTSLFMALRRGFRGKWRITPDQYEDFQAQARRLRCRNVALELFQKETPYLRAIERDIGELATPTLILWGEADVFVRSEMGMLLKATHPDAELEIVPECGHFLHHENSDWFAQRVGSFAAAVDRRMGDR